MLTQSSFPAVPMSCTDVDGILFQQILDGIERAAWEQKTSTMGLGESLAQRLMVWFAK